MIRNVGNKDRLIRFVAALPLLVCSVLAPLPPLARILAFALPGLYLGFSALVGSCLGYRLMGRSTCEIPRGGSHGTA